MAACWAVASSARANGRFPRAERLIEDPRDPDHLTLAATYGLVVTRDRGVRWYYICEASFAGIDGYVGDPLFDFAADGTMLVDVQSSLNVSADEGCSWSPAFGGSGAYVPDFTVSRNDGRILSLISANEDGGVAVRVGESTDQGKSFHLLGTALPTGIAFTIDVPPSQPDSIYVSARSKTNAPELLRSTDRGNNWTHIDLSIGADEVPYIAAIDPNDPDKIFLRTDVQTTIDGVLTADDALYYTADGGMSWREEFRAPAQMLGFALSPDGGTVVLGYGDPVDADIPVDPTVLGVYRAATSDFAFTRLSTESTTCLSWTKTGIYVCTSPQDTGYALAFAEGSSLGPDGGGLTPLLYLNELQGPPPCCGARAAACAASWPSTCATFGACDAGVSNDASCGAAPANDTDANDVLPEASISDSGSPVDAEPSSPTPNVGGNASSGCGVAGRSINRAPWEAVLALAFLGGAARRRANRARPRRSKQSTAALKHR
jgi:hypothetical protein